MDLKHISLILLTIIAPGINAQSFVYQRDYKTILSASKEPTDELYYERLLGRYNRNDTTLDPPEVLALLIGFTGTPAYKPFDDIVTEKQINELNSSGAYLPALKLANSFLQTHPLNQQAIVAKSFAFYKLGMPDSSEYYVFQFDAIMKAMAYSGSGKMPDSAIFALEPGDAENFIRRYLKGTAGNSADELDSKGNYVNATEAKLNGKSPFELYFAIQHALDSMLEPSGKKGKKGKSK